MKTTYLASACLALGLATSAGAAPVQWTSASGGNDHWYEVIWAHANLTWNQANAAAQSLVHDGETGYLASITSAAEQAFLNGVNNAFTTASSSHHGTYVTAWIGANDAAVDGAFEWTSGEAFGYSNWAGGEPNNWGGDEDYVQGWWSGDDWNDAGLYSTLQKYVVEYDSATNNNTNPVPVPASLPMALAGFGVMAWIGRRRKKA